MNNDMDNINYLTIDELSDFLQAQGYSTSKPSLVKQQMYGVMMRSLPEKDLFRWSRDTRKRLYHRFSAFESITASLLFAGRYWNRVKGIRAARLVHFDVFIGRLGYYAETFPKINVDDEAEKRSSNLVSSFSFSLNDVFRKLIQESDRFMIVENKNCPTNSKIETIEKKYSLSNSKFDERILQLYYKDYNGFTNMLIINNEIRMEQDQLENAYNCLARAACRQIFSGADANSYMKYQTMLYTQTMEGVIARYNAKLANFMTKR